MIATVELSAAEQAKIIAIATERATNQILAEALLTRDEAAAMLRVTTHTLNRLPISRVKVGGATRYRRFDIGEYIRASLEK